MLNKKVIVTIVVTILVFLGIYSFAQSNDNVPDKKEKNNKIEEKKDETDQIIDDEEELDKRVPLVPVFRTSDITLPVITMAGDAIVTIEVGTNYTDAGATATDNVDGIITSTIVAVSTVNKDVVGEYTVTYNVTDSAGNAAAQVTRTVKVVDTIEPVIELVGNATVYIDLGGTYTELGTNVIDNYDSEIAVSLTGTVNTNVAGKYILTYTATDKGGNVADAVVRTVYVRPIIFGITETSFEIGTIFTAPKLNVKTSTDGETISLAFSESNIDENKPGNYKLKYTYKTEDGIEALPKEVIVNVTDTTRPVITLNGSNPQIIPVKTSYEELGAKVEDNSGKELKPVINSKNVNTNVVGEYTVTYNVSDGYNRAIEVTRTVKVVDRTVPTLNLYVGSQANSAQTLYLTVEGGINIDSIANKLGYKVYDAVDGTLAIHINADVAFVNDAVSKSFYKLNQTTQEYEKIEAINTKQLGTYKIIYSVSDKSGNTTMKYRILNIVDTTAPTLNLYVGSQADSAQTLYLTVEGGIDINSIANKLGYKVYDAVDGTLASHINASVAFINDAVSKSFYKLNQTTQEYEKIEAINTKQLGTYKIIYSVSDKTGNTAMKYRILNIVDTTAPTLNLYVGSQADSAQILYLTVEGGININSIANKLGYKVYDAVDGTLASHINASVAFINDAVSKSFYKLNQTTQEYEKIEAINTKQLGTYKIIYSVSDKTGNTTMKYRILNIVDTTAPTLNLYVGDLGDSAQTLYLTLEVFTNLDSIANKLGYKVYDAVDGTLASHINASVAFVNDAVSKSFYKLNQITQEYEKIETINTTQLGVYKIIYGVSDKTGNTTIKNRIINVVDSTAPVITLVDGNMELVIGETFTDPGFYVSDNYVSLTNADVTVTGGVNPNAEGTYTLTYSATDGVNTTLVNRTVVVKPLINIISVYNPGEATKYNGFNILFNRDFVVIDPKQVKVTYEYSINDGSYVTANVVKYPGVVVSNLTYQQEERKFTTFFGRKVYTEPEKKFTTFFEMWQDANGKVLTGFNGTGTIKKDSIVSMQEHEVQDRLRTAYNAVQAGQKVNIVTVLTFKLENGTVVTYKLDPVQYN